MPEPISFIASVAGGLETPGGTCCGVAGGPKASEGPTTPVPDGSGAAAARLQQVAVTQRLSGRHAVVSQASAECVAPKRGVEQKNWLEMSMNLGLKLEHQVTQLRLLL